MDCFAEMVRLARVPGAHLVLLLGLLVQGPLACGDSMALATDDEDPTEELTWEALPDPPINLWRPGVAEVDGQLYFTGSDHNAYEVGALLIFDVALQSWTRGPDVPSPVDGSGVVARQGRVHVLGGYIRRNGPRSSGHFVFDPTPGVWAVLPPVPEAVDAASATAVGSTIYLMGSTLR